MLVSLEEAEKQPGSQSPSQSAEHVQVVFSQLTRNSTNCLIRTPVSVLSSQFPVFRLHLQVCELPATSARLYLVVLVLGLHNLFCKHETRAIISRANVRRPTWVWNGMVCHVMAWGDLGGAERELAAFYMFACPAPCGNDFKFKICEFEAVYRDGILRLLWQPPNSASFA